MYLVEQKLIIEEDINLLIKYGELRKRFGYIKRIKEVFDTYSPEKIEKSKTARILFSGLNKILPSIYRECSRDKKVLERAKNYFSTLGIKARTKLEEIKEIEELMDWLEDEVSSFPLEILE